MTEHEKMEFWQALGRLYDSSLALQRASEALQKISEGHEKRLDRLEVVQQWLAEKERRAKRETSHNVQLQFGSAIFQQMLKTNNLLAWFVVKKLRAGNPKPSPLAPLLY